MVRNKPLGATPPTAEPAATNPLRAMKVDRAQGLGATEATGAHGLGATEVAGARGLGATEVDHRLRRALHELQLAERNAVLWFDEVLRRRLFRELGFSSIYHYAGEALGFSRPRTAQFIRLCESLDELPALKSSVAAGEVSWTKAREVAKVATAQTESAWVDLARRESRRKLERRVRMAQTRSRARRRSNGRQLGLDDDARQTGLADDTRQQDHTCSANHGDSNDDPRRPGMDGTDSKGAGLSTLRATATNDGDDRATQPTIDFFELPVTLSLRFTPEQYARYEAILEKLRKRGDRADREELVLAGLEALLVEAGSTGQNSTSGAETVSTAPGVTSWPVNKAVRSPRDTGSASNGDMKSPSPRETAAVSPRNPKRGSQIPVYQIVVQQCEDCGRARVQTSRGAKRIDPVAAAAMRCDARVLRPGEKNRATIPPAVRREVMARDGHRCCTPGCGSARFLEVHHVVPREAGGSNRPDNLITLCSACHRLAHTKTGIVRDARPGYGTGTLTDRAARKSVYVCDRYPAGDKHCRRHGWRVVRGSLTT